jgi:DNA-binding response OmpR family regulator
MQALAEVPSLETSIRAHLLCHGEEPPSSLALALQNEVIALNQLSWTALEEELASDCSVLILWVSSLTEPERIRNAVRWIRESGKPVAILGCAPTGDIEDSVRAFEAGVDDFIAGRSSAREIACRIRALHRRTQRRSGRRQLRSSRLALDPFAQEALLDNDRRVRLTSIELSVLRTLLQAQGEALSRSQILDRAWGDQTLSVGERAVDNVILRLRRKLGDAGLIETVRGVGFRFAVE